MLVILTNFVKITVSNNYHKKIIPFESNLILCIIDFIK